MFHRYNRNKANALSQDKSTHKDLLKVLSPRELLQDEKRQNLLKIIQENSALEEARFNHIGLNLIHQLLLFAQKLPETSNSYYSDLCGIIDHALNRTDSALNLLKHYLITDDNILSEEQILWQYALMSAAILQGIGKLQIDYQIDIHDKRRAFQKHWNPLIDNPAAPGSLYSWQFEKESDEEFRCRLNILFARMLMPAAGFSWICSNIHVLEVWLALLNEDYYAAGTLGAILIRANAISIQRFFNTQATFSAKTGRPQTSGAFIGHTPDENRDPVQELGREFHQWIIQSIENKSLVLNKSPLIMVAGGLLISTELFKRFVRDNPACKSWQLVLNGFLTIGIHKTDPNGSDISKFEHNNTNEMHEGVWINKNYASLLPNEVQWYEPTSGKTFTLSAIEVIALAQNNSSFTLVQTNPTNNLLKSLNPAGHWQSTEKTSIAAHLFSPRAGKSG